jgi:periplasmic protein TonB
MSPTVHTSHFAQQNATPLSAKLVLIAVVAVAHLAVLYLGSRPPTINVMTANELSVSFALPKQALSSRIPQHHQPVSSALPVVERIAQAQPMPVAEQATNAAAPVVETPAPGPEAIEPDYRASYLNNVPPAYPLAARRMGLQGRVVLYVEVLSGGTCGQINIQTSSGFAMLDNAALQAVKTWHFVPARQAGNPVDKWFVIPVQFSLKDNA